MRFCCVHPIELPLCKVETNMAPRGFRTHVEIHVETDVPSSHVLQSEQAREPTEIDLVGRGAYDQIARRLARVDANRITEAFDRRASNRQLVTHRACFSNGDHRP